MSESTSQSILSFALFLFWKIKISSFILILLSLQAWDAIYRLGFFIKHVFIETERINTATMGYIRVVIPLVKVNRAEEVIRNPE